MRVYILYEKYRDIYGIGRRASVVGVYAQRIKAEKAEREYTQNAKRDGQDYTYCIVPEEMK